jgi:hypothetical protein
MPPPPVQPQAPGQQPGQGRDHGTVSPRWMILLGQPFLLTTETGAARDQRFSRASVAAACPVTDSYAAGGSGISGSSGGLALTFPLG